MSESLMLLIATPAIVGRRTAKVWARFPALRAARVDPAITMRSS
jgi:hypothetical protein